MNIIANFIFYDVFLGHIDLLYLVASTDWESYAQKCLYDLCFKFF